MAAKTNDYHYLDEAAIQDDLKCAVCLEPLVDPVVHQDGRCGNSFCRACMAEQKQCPTCRGTEMLNQPSPRMVHNMLANLKVSCAACNAQLTRGEWPAHAPRCPRPCHRRCGYAGPPDTHAAHEANECPRAPLACGFCDAPFERQAVAAHVATCPAAVIPCADCGVMLARAALAPDAAHESECHRLCVHPNCGVRRTRAEEAAHEAVCPHAPVTCASCDVVIARGEMGDPNRHTEACGVRALARVRMANEPPIVLSVGGRYFSTTLTTLRSAPGSALSAFFSQPEESWVRDQDGRVALDCDPDAFNNVLQWLRRGMLGELDSHSRAILRAEATFWRLDDLLAVIGTKTRLTQKELFDTLLVYRSLGQPAVFTGLDLSGLTMAGLDLSGATFQDCILRGTIFKKTNLARAIFLDVDLQGASFEQARGSADAAGNLCFENANLRQANFRQFYTNRASFKNVDATNANFLGANCTASFENVNVTSAILSAGSFPGIWKNVNAARVVANGAKFSHAVFDGVVLDESDVRGTAFDRVNFTTTSLRGAQITGCSFQASSAGNNSITRDQVATAVVEPDDANNATVFPWSGDGARSRYTPAM